jgi:hypothetical protein
MLGQHPASHEGKKIPSFNGKPLNKGKINFNFSVVHKYMRKNKLFVVKYIKCLRVLWISNILITLLI